MKVKDPVCGRMIDKKDAAETSTFKGKTYYFCSRPCMVNFEKDPMIYTGERTLDLGPYPRKKDNAA